MGKQSLIKFRVRRPEDSHGLAFYGFAALGPMAKPAVPALIDLLKDKDQELRLTAAYCLGAIGPEAKGATPHLINGAINGGQVQLDIGQTIIALGCIHSDPEMTVPFLVNYVTNVILSCGFFAMDALGRFGTNAHAAVPMLEEVASKTLDSNAMVFQALERIDPEAWKAAVEKCRQTRKNLISY
jgi:hypothetical protein